MDVKHLRQIFTMVLLFCFLCTPCVPSHAQEIQWYITEDGGILGPEGWSISPDGEVLVADNCDITNLTPLVDSIFYLPVMTMYLPHNRIVDLAPLQDMIWMFSLNVSYNRITDITPLSGMDEIMYLYLSGNAITDFTPLYDKPELMVLWLNDIPDLDLHWLQNLPRLQEIHLANNGLSNDDLLPLANIKPLYRLNVSGNQLGTLSVVSALSDEFTFLFVDDTGISDLQPLTAHGSLIELYARDNQITDLTPLQELMELEILDISGNPVTDLTPLYALRILEKLYIMDMPYLSQEQVDALREALYWCEIFYSAANVQEAP